MTEKKKLIITWMEEVVKRVMTEEEDEISSMFFAKITGAGGCDTTYFGGSMFDKLVIAGVIQQDAMLQTLAENSEDEYDEGE